MADLGLTFGNLASRIRRGRTWVKDNPSGGTRSAFIFTAPCYPRNVMPKAKPSATSPAMQAADYESRLMMARDTFRELQTHIQTADQKVQFVLTANAFLAASVSFEGRN